jgi:hypothetical protein
MADKVNITVRRNWKKKIEKLSNVTKFKSYSLHSNFVGVEIDMGTPEAMYEWVKKELAQMHRTRLSYNKDNGACCLHVHSNQWFSWTCKIDW